MHVLNIALAILGLSSTSLSYYIHPSCDCYNDNGKNNIEAGIQEAINILEYSGSVANMCADPDDPIVISGGKPYGQLCENDRNSNLLQDFFQDDSPEMYQKVAGVFLQIQTGLIFVVMMLILEMSLYGPLDALLPASKSAGERSNQPDNAFTIVCGDSHLNRISSTTYRDRDRDFAYVGMTPTVPEGGRPCDVVEALAYFTAKGSVVMICDSQNRGVNQAPTNEFLNKRNIIGKDVEWLARTISGVFVHEMTHIGDSNACENSISFLYFFTHQRFRSVKSKERNADTMCLFKWFSSKRPRKRTNGSLPVCRLCWPGGHARSPQKL